MLSAALCAAFASACTREPVPAPVALTDSPAMPTELCLAGDTRRSLEPTPPRLLTREELNNTLRDLLFDTTRPASAFPPENRTMDFENNASSHSVSPLLVKSYLLAAEEIAARAVKDHLRELVPCKVTDATADACAEHFLVTFTRRAFRRPATAAELAPLRALFAATRAESDFRTAVEWTVQAVLQSPQFLYRIEFGEPTPGESVVPLTGLELASRLSFFLWASLPDDALLLAAERGELGTAEGVAAQARRMIADPRARHAVRSFHRQWLHLDGLDALSKSSAAFPEYTPELRESWHQSVDAFVEDAFWNQGTLSALFTSPALYLDARLAALYGQPVPAGSGMHAVSADPRQRAGILTQPALMALLSTSNQGSPIKRGVFTREKILCQTLAPPPPDIPIVPPDPHPDATTRERFAEHTASAACAGCHRMIDPVGFGFERYDSLGRYREVENGKPVDSRGELSATREDAIEGPFQDAVELTTRLAHSSQVRDCVASQWYRFAMGRLEQANDLCSLREVQGRFARSKGDLKDLLVAITLTPAFRYKPAGATP